MPSDPLRDAEAAAYEVLAERFVTVRMPVDAWREVFAPVAAAIEARVRGERDAEVRALVEAVAEFRALPMLRGESGAVPSFTVTYKDTGVLDRLDAAHKPFEEAQP